MQPYNSNRWDEWMSATLKGDKNAYRLLLTELHGWLTAYYRKRVAEPHVEDLVQETMMALHAKMQTFDPNQKFGPWIAAIAKYRMIDHFRKTGRHIHVELPEDVSSPHTDDAENASHDVEIMLNQIPSEQAKVIRMMKLEELSVADISERTGHSQSSVKVMVHRGMQKMQKLAKKNKA